MRASSKSSPRQFRSPDELLATSGKPHNENPDFTRARPGYGLQSAQTGGCLHQSVDDQFAPGRAVAGVLVRNEAAAAEPGMVQVAAGPVDAHALAVGEPDIAEPVEARFEPAVRRVDLEADEQRGRRLQAIIAEILVQRQGGVRDRRGG